MFDQTFVDNGQRTKKPATLVLSLFLQICAVCLLILIPLVYTQALPNAQLKSVLTAPRPPVAQAKPPIAVSTQHVTITRRFSVALLAPTVIPKRINNVVETAATPDVALPSGAGEANGATDDVISSVIASAPGPPPAPPSNVKPHGPVKIGGGVAEANLIRKIVPVYPPLARSARVQGTVEFTAIISRQGMIENLQLVRGHPLLVQAAKDAVLQWRYRPTLLNGQPVEVVTDIIVNFNLSQ